MCRNNTNNCQNEYLQKIKSGINVYLAGLDYTVCFGVTAAIVVVNEVLQLIIVIIKERYLSRGVSYVMLN